MRWQVQEAKQRFSEVLRAARREPQIVTRHGEEIAVVIDIVHYHRLRGVELSLMGYLGTGGHLHAELEVERSAEPPREIELPV